MNEKPDICKGFLAEIQERGLPKAAGEGMLVELGLTQTSTLSKKAREQEFLNKFNHRYASLQELQQALVDESQNFREGLKEAMLAEGVAEETIEGIFKEAELRFSELVRADLQKEAGIGSALRQWGAALKAPLTRGSAAGRGFSKVLDPLSSVRRQGTEDFLKTIVPGLDELKGLGKLDELSAGSTRINLGDQLAKTKMFGGLGDRIRASGENAMRSQATRLADSAYVEKTNAALQQARNEARTAGGVTQKTQQQLDSLKNKAIPNVSPAGGVPQNTIQAGIDSATLAAKDPLGAKNIVGTSGPGSFLGARWTPGKGLNRGLWGAGLGTLVGGPVGGVLGGLGGAVTGTLGTRGALMGAGALYGANKFLGSKPAPTADRNRVLPFMGNQWTGGAGGALLGAVIANELGLEGAGSWLLPLLGGVAGYNYLPDLVNNYKDPLGYGNNAIPTSHQAGNLRTFGYTPQ